MSDKQTTEIEKSAANKDAPKDANKDAPKDATKDAAKDATKDTAKDATKDAAKGTTATTSKSQETKVTTSADGGTVTKTTVTKTETKDVSKDEKDTKQAASQGSSLVETKTASKTEVAASSTTTKVQGGATTTKVVETTKVVKEAPKVVVSQEVTQIQSNLKEILGTETSPKSVGGTKYEFKEEDASKRDNESHGHIERIEYVKINENTLLNDASRFSFDKTYQTGTFNSGYESSGAQGALYTYGDSRQFTTGQYGGGFTTGQFTSGVESYKEVKTEDIYKDFDASKFTSGYTVNKTEIYKDFIPSSSYVANTTTTLQAMPQTTTTYQTTQVHVPQFSSSNYQFEQGASSSTNFQFQVEKDFKIDYEKDFKFDFVADNKVTEYKQSDFKIEDFSKQNDEMFKSIEQTSFGKTEFTFAEPPKQEYNVTESKTYVVESAVDESKNISMLHEAETRHQSQVDALHSQISSQESKYAQQISTLQMEKSDLEKKLVLAERKYTELGQSFELKFQDRQSSMSSQHESYKHEIQRLTQALQDQERKHIQSIEVIRQHESHQSGFKSQFEGLV